MSTRLVRARDEVGEAGVDPVVFVARRLRHEHAVDDEPCAAAREREARAVLRLGRDLPGSGRRFLAPVEVGRQRAVRDERRAREADLGRDRHGLVGRRHESRRRDEDRLGHDPGQDRERVDAGVEHAEAGRLPDPGLARMPAADILLPGDGEAAKVAAREPVAHRLDRGIVLRMPGREEHAAGSLGLLRQRSQLADGRGRRLLHQHVEPAIERLAHERGADVRRRADRDGVEVRQRIIGLGGGAEGRHAVHDGAAAAHHPREFEPRVARDRGQMLVARDLADADHGDADRGHVVSIPAWRPSARALRARAISRPPPPGGERRSVQCRGRFETGLERLLARLRAKRDALRHDHLDRGDAHEGEHAFQVGLGMLEGGERRGSAVESRHAEAATITRLPPASPSAPLSV